MLFVGINIAGVEAMNRTQVQLTEAQMQALKKLAAENDTSVSELVRQSVDLMIMTRRIPDRNSQFAQAKSVAGRFRSGLGNLARDHDRYLWGREQS